MGRRSFRRLRGCDTFTILAALTLTACALPGASGGNSFMSAMHPTQDFCEQRGLTLDATTKQCVTPPKRRLRRRNGNWIIAASRSRAESRTGTVTAGIRKSSTGGGGANASRRQQPPPQQHQRADPEVPIEPEAVIYPQLAQNSDLMSELTHFVRASGYRCDSISALGPRPSGFTLVCDRSNYKYAIVDKDGRSTVTAE